METKERSYMFTEYIYPISKPITLLEKYGLCLDNPRNKKEINDARKLIQYSLTEKYCSHFIIGKNRTDKEVYFSRTIDKMIMGDKHSEFLFKPFPKDDSYVNAIYSKMCGHNLVEVLSRIWVIIRFDNNVANNVCSYRYKALEEAKARKDWLGINSPVDIIRDRFLDIEAMAALIYWNGDTREAPGDNFIMDDISFRYDSDINSKKNFMLYIWVHKMSQIKDRSMRGAERFPFHTAILKWCSIFKGINDALEGDNEKNILFMSNLLKVATDEGLDVKAKFVILTSIIEMLLTHSPDHRRYNVEESINKQFILKAASVIYQNDKTFGIDNLKKNLKHIYEIRSLIAHGNFKGLLKYGTLDDGEDSLDMYIYTLCDTVYVYIKKILEEYFKDRGYIEFLKDN